MSSTVQCTAIQFVTEYEYSLYSDASMAKMLASYGHSSPTLRTCLFELQSRSGDLHPAHAANAVVNV